MPEYGTYCSLNRMKRALGITDTVDDSELLSKLESVSRWIDDYCHRWFYIVESTRYFTAVSRDVVLIDDLIAIVSLATDPSADRAYTDTWAAADYDLEPYNSYPKEAIHTSPMSDYCFRVGLAKGVKIVGSWGYGDGTSSPWKAAGANVTCTDSGTTLTLSAVGDLSAGQVIMVGTEQMYLTAVTGGASPTAIAVRGVNGTTAAAHNAAAASINTYPKPIEEAAIIQTSRIFRRKDAPFGIIGAADVGSQVVIGQLDPDVKQNIRPYRRIEGA